MLLGGQMPLSMLQPRLEGIGVARFDRSTPAAVAALAASMADVGQRVPILVNGLTNEVIDGDMRVMAAQRLGWATIGAVATTDFNVIATHLKETLEIQEEGELPHLPYTRTHIAIMAILLRSVYQETVPRPKGFEELKRTLKKLSPSTFATLSNDASSSGPAYLRSLLGPMLFNREMISGGTIERALKIGYTYHVLPTRFRARALTILKELDEDGAWAKASRKMLALAEEAGVSVSLRKEGSERAARRRANSPTARRRNSPPMDVAPAPPVQRPFPANKLADQLRNLVAAMDGMADGVEEMMRRWGSGPDLSSKDMYDMASVLYSAARRTGPLQRLLRSAAAERGEVDA